MVQEKKKKERENINRESQSTYLMIDVLQLGVIFLKSLLNAIN